MKKKPFLLLLLLVFSFVISLNNFQNVLGYETETDTKLNLSNTSNNSELLGCLATIDTYDYYTLPRIDANIIEHDLTQIKINSLQKYDESCSVSDYDSLNGISDNIYNDIEGYTVSAPFDTSITIHLQNSFEYRNYNTENYLVASKWDYTTIPVYPTVWNYDTENLNAFDSQYLHIEGYENIRLLFDAEEYYDRIDFLAYTSPYNGLFKITYKDTSYDVYSLYPSGSRVSYSIDNTKLVNHLSILVGAASTFDIDYCVLKNSGEDNYIPFTEPFISEVEIQDFEYEINSISYFEDITMTLLSTSFNYDSEELEFIFDSSQLDNYDYLNDLTIPAQSINFLVSFSRNLIYNIDITHYVSCTFFLWCVPSEINLAINGIFIDDESFNSGMLNLADYPEQLIFTANIPNVLFEFELTTYFEYDFELNIISHSYLKSILLLDFEDDMLIDVCTFGIGSEILKCYINNIEQSNTKTIYPAYPWRSDSSCKIELLIQDDIYEEMEFDSIEQISSDIDTDDLVQYNFNYHAERIFSRWYAEIDYTVINYAGTFGAISLNIENDNMLYLFVQELNLYDEVDLLFTINPNYDISYEIVSESQDQISLKIYYQADLDVNNVDLKIQLPFYFQSWDTGTQDSNNILTIEDLDFETSENYIIINGEFQTPYDIEFSQIYNTESFSVYEGFEENINYAALIDDIGYKIKYGKIYPEEEWNSLELFNNSDSELILTEESEFYTQNGFQSGYLYFKCNPVISFETISSLDKITLNINMSLNASNIIIVFEINSDEHYELNNKMNILEVSELSENLYYIYYDLSEGMNTIDIYIKIYSGNNIFTYILIGLGIVAAIGLVYLMKKRKTASKHKI